MESPRHAMWTSRSFLSLQKGIDEGDSRQADITISKAECNVQEHMSQAQKPWMQQQRQRRHLIFQATTQAPRARSPLQSFCGETQAHRVSHMLQKRQVQQGQCSTQTYLTAQRTCLQQYPLVGQLCSMTQ